MKTDLESYTKHGDMEDNENKKKITGKAIKTLKLVLKTKKKFNI